MTHNPYRNLNIRLFRDDLRRTLASEAQRRGMSLSEYIRLVLAQKAREIDRAEQDRQEGQ